MTSCFGYLGVTINDRTELEELFHVDVLVSCPPHFNVTFSVPNWRWRPDCTFDVILDDAHSSYRVFLTTITFHGRRAHTCAPDTHTDDVISRGVAEWSVVALVSVVIILSVVAVGSCAYAALETTGQRPISAVDEPEVALTGTGSAARHPADCERRRRRAIVVVRVVLRVVFALSLTFTACSTAFYVSQWRRVADAGHLSATRRRFEVDAATARDRLVDHVTTQPGADVARVREMQLACDGYVSELASAVDDRVATASKADDAGSAGRMYRRAMVRISDDLDRLIDDFRRRLDVQLRPVGARFRRVVKQSLNVPWFSYARSLFNKTARRSAHSTPPSPSTLSDSVNFLLPHQTSSFAKFLRVYSVEEVESWHRRFSERYILTQCRTDTIRYDTAD